jgi:hypothetical protein
MTTIDHFAETYHGDARPVDEVIDRWVLEKRVADFLGARILGGVMIADLMVGDRLVDTIPPDVKAGFFHLMGDQAATREEVAQIIIQKAADSREAVVGLMNKIQGQLGEDAFVRAVGHAAALAPSGSQEGWDIVVHHEGFSQYVQVKVYKNANKAIQALNELQQKVDAGQLHDGAHVIHSVDFAVNADIYDDVSRKASELGFRAHILNLGVTRDDLRDHLNQAVDHVSGAPLHHFFHELLGGVESSAALHAAANAFLVYKGAKEAAVAVEDAAYSTLVSAGGLLAAHATDALAVHAAMFAGLEKAAAILSGPAGAVVIFGVGMGARGLLRRIADRRHVAKRLRDGNARFLELVETLASYGQTEVLAAT